MQRKQNNLYSAKAYVHTQVSKWLAGTGQGAVTLKVVLKLPKNSQQKQLSSCAYLVPLTRLYSVEEYTARMLTPDPTLTTRYGYGLRKSKGFFTQSLSKLLL